MLSFFPNPYPDEILYSVFARYHIRSGNLGPKQTMQELFNSQGAIATVDLPCNLAALADNLSHLSDVSAEALIQKYTLYPFYAPFLPPERSQQIRQALKSDSGGSIHDQTRIRASVIKTPKFLRFCPQCAAEDQANWGELYWHRSHHVPGNLMCPIMGCSYPQASKTELEVTRIPNVSAKAFLSFLSRIKSWLRERSPV